ncbi:unnamed protein product [Prunus armeniaca]
MLKIHASEPCAKLIGYQAKKRQLAKRKKALNATKEFSQSYQDMFPSDKCPIEVRTSLFLWLLSIISPRGSTAGSYEEVPAAVLGVPRKGEVGGSAVGSCEEVPVAVSSVPRGGEGSISFALCEMLLI